MNQRKMAGSGQTTVITQPAAGSDDARFDGAGTFSSSATSIIFGLASGPTTWTSYIRMVLNVPYNATIVSAQLTGRLSVTRSNRAPSIKIDADKSGLDPSVAGSKAAADARARTTANVNYKPGTVTLTADTDHTITGLASIIQELVSQAGWASGNHIILYLTDNGDSGASSDINWYSWDHSTNPEPYLTVVYR